MPSVKLHQVDAFAERAFEGNPAAVCPLEAWLPAVTMQAIAAENNLSETAFSVPRGPDWELRWFTPVAEVDLCGHATLATAHVLFAEHPERELLRFHTKGGLLEARRSGERIELDFPALPGERAQMPAELVAGLGLAPREVWRNADYWMAVYEREQDVRDLRPDSSALARDARGFVVTARGREADFVSRMFAPSVGIAEDPVCGSAHCLLTPYWAERLGRSELFARQVSARGGSLWCTLAGARVRIAGHAVRVLEGTLFVP